MDMAIRPLDPAFRVFGPAFTVLCKDGDNLPIHRAVAAATKGSILVVGGTERQVSFGYFGEILATNCKKTG